MGIWGEIASSKATHKKLQLPHGWLQGLLSRAHSIRKCPPSASAWGWATAITTTTSPLLSTPCFLLRHFSSASGPSASTSSSHALPSNRPRNSSKRPLLAATLPRVWGGSWTPRAVMVKKMLVVAVTVTMVGWRVVTLQLKVPFWLVCCLWVLLVDLPLLGMSTGTRSMPSWLSFRASLKVICYNLLHIWFFLRVWCAFCSLGRLDLGIRGALFVAFWEFGDSQLGFYCCTVWLLINLRKRIRN